MTRICRICHGGGRVVRPGSKIKQKYLKTKREVLLRSYLLFSTNMSRLVLYILVVAAVCSCRQQPKRGVPAPESIEEAEKRSVTSQADLLDCPDSRKNWEAAKDQRTSLGTGFDVEGLIKAVNSSDCKALTLFFSPDFQLLTGALVNSVDSSTVIESRCSAVFENDEVRASILSASRSRLWLRPRTQDLMLGCGNVIVDRSGQLSDIDVKLSCDYGTGWATFVRALPGSVPTGSYYEDLDFKTVYDALRAFQREFFEPHSDLGASGEIYLHTPGSEGVIDSAARESWKNSARGKHFGELLKEANVCDASQSTEGVSWGLAPVGSLCAEYELLFRNVGGELELIAIRDELHKFCDY